MFRKATRTQSRLRCAISGPSGSGKSYTALRLAQGLAKAAGGRIAVIDSERGSASKYAGEAPDDEPFDFDVVELEHYSPNAYIQCLAEAGRQGYAVVVIDSLSHAWQGKGGILEQKDKKGGSIQSWADLTPQQNALIDAIFSCPCHVIATMRSKTDWVMEQGNDGKVKPRKVGLAPVQRPGVEYEFDVMFELDPEHVITVSKTRCQALDGMIAPLPGRRDFTPLINWLMDGASAPAIAPPAPAQQEGEKPPAEGRMRLGKMSTNRIMAGPMQLAKLKQLAEELGWWPDKLREILAQKGFSQLDDLDVDNANTLYVALRDRTLEREGQSL